MSTGENMKLSDEAKRAFTVQDYSSKSKIAGVEFADCYPRRQMMSIDDLTVPVISLDDLRKNKLATGRPKDAGDVQQLDTLKNSN